MKTLTLERDAESLTSGVMAVVSDIWAVSRSLYAGLDCLSNCVDLSNYAVVARV